MAFTLQAVLTSLAVVLPIFRVRSADADAVFAEVRATPRPSGDCQLSLRHGIPVPGREKQ